MEMEAIRCTGKKIAEMIRKGITKSKLILEIHLLFKRSNKAISNLLSSCKSNHITRFSFISPTSYYNHYHHNNPKEYEFSCSNSPITTGTVTNFPTSASSLILRNKNLHQRRRRRKYNKYCLDHDITTATTARNVLDNNDNEMVVEGSPLVGFGGRCSPSTVRQLRITDSPFPIKECDDGENGVQVNEAAEDFINRFYMDLRSQKSPATFESPYRIGSYIYS